MPEVKDRILSEYDSLSKAQKKCADFIMSNFDAAAMLSSIKLSLRAGVSESTVVRLAYALGYEGFSDLQKQIRQDYLTSFRGNAPGTDVTNEYEDLVAREIHNLQELQSYVSDPVKLERIAKILIEADMVEVFGYSNARVDELLALGAAEPDKAQRKVYYDEIQEILVEELPYVNIAEYASVEGCAANLKNVPMDGAGKWGWAEWSNAYFE